MSWFQRLIKYLFWPRKKEPSQMRVEQISKDLGLQKLRQNNGLRKIYIRRMK